MREYLQGRAKEAKRITIYQKLHGQVSIPLRVEAEFKNTPKRSETGRTSYLRKPPPARASVLESHPPYVESYIYNILPFLAKNEASFRDD